MANEKGGGDVVVPILTITGILLPRIMEAMTHYGELSSKADSQGNIALTPDDKTRMKANLEQLRLPNWDDI